MLAANQEVRVSPKRFAIVLAAFAALIVITGTAEAKRPLRRPSVRTVANGDCVSSGGTLVTPTSVTVDGVPQTRTNGAPWVLICRNTSPATYSISWGLDQSGTSINEELGGANLAKAFAVTFSTSSDAASMLMTLGDTQSFVINGSTVTVTAKPVATTKIDFANGDPCKTAPFTEACAGGGTKTNYAAFLNETLRYGTDSYSKLTGAYLSATASLFDAQLDSACFGAQADAGQGVERDLATLLNLKLLGPHFKADNTTLNTGTMRVVIPVATILTCFGTSATPTGLVSETTMDRTESGTTVPVLPTGSGGLQYTITPGIAGLTIAVPTVTFSQPTYGMHFTRPKTGGSSSSSSAASSSGSSATSSGTGRIAGVSWKAAKGKVTASFAAATTVKSYGIKATLKGKSKTGTCSIKSKKATCTIKGLAAGAWAATVSSKLKAGGAGPTASKTITVK